MSSKKTSVNYKTIRIGAVAKGSAAVGLLTFGALTVGTMYIAKLMARGGKVERRTAAAVTAA